LPIPSIAPPVTWRKRSSPLEADPCAARRGWHRQARRKARDATFSPPTLLLPALQVNIRAGALPPPTPEGRVFLRSPVTLG
jgi:hypothetical protein